MFGKMQEMREMQKQAQAMKKQMETEIIEYENDGIKIVLSGTQEIQSVEFEDGFDFSDKDETGKKVKDAINGAIKESQKVVAQKMRGSLGM